MSYIPADRFHHAMKSKENPVVVANTLEQTQQPEVVQTQPTVQVSPAQTPAPIQQVVTPPEVSSEPQAFTVSLDNNIFTLTPPIDAPIPEVTAPAQTPAPVQQVVTQPEVNPAIEAMERELAELRAYKKKQELEQQLNLSNVQFETMDAAAIKEIKDKLLQPTLEYSAAKYNEHLTKLERELEQERTARRQFEEQNQLQHQANTYRRINNDIQAVHPDVQSIINSEGFTRYLNSTVGSSSITLGSLLVPEYQKGNAKFVIDIITSYKQQQPMLSNFVSVSPNPVATQAVNGVQAGQITQQSISDLNRAMFTGEISRAEFSEKLKQIREIEQHNKGKR